MPKIHGNRPATYPPYPLGVKPEPPAGDETGVSAPPAAKAPKAEWVAYAESQGVDASGTKAQIRARF